MARKPTLSPTKLTCYLACPHKYFWTYLSPHGQWFLKTHSYFSFGQSIHRALEEFHRSGAKGVPIREALASALEENWLESGYANPTEMQAARGEAKMILDDFASDFEQGAISADRNSEVLFVEKSLRKSMGEWSLIGRADRIDLLKTDGEPHVVEVVDYKSRRETVSEAEVKSDISMSCYALMVRDIFPEARVRTTIHALKSGVMASHDFTHDELDEIAFAVQELGDMILNHYWEELHPIAKPLCTRCDFLSLCRKQPEFAAALPDANEPGETPPLV